MRTRHGVRLISHGRDLQGQLRPGGTGDVLRQGVSTNWAAFGLDMAGSDVLLTLRRQGQGASLSPSDLAKEMMLSTSAITNRLDRLEKRGLIKRSHDPANRRGLRILLTDEGFGQVEEMIITHVATEEALLSVLSTKERTQLRTLLEKVESAKVDG